jgi:cation diffusion facilitator family transporter
MAAERSAARGQTRRTIVVALLANLAVAVAKLVAGLLSGSVALLSEAGHSAADALNEVFLGVSMMRARRPADERHPLGHGRERFLWAFMAAISSFLIGGCLSIALAVWSLVHGGANQLLVIAWVVLAVAAAADGASLSQGLRQARREAHERGLSLPRYLLHASDPALRAVVVEDSAALVGDLLAAGGLLVSDLTGSNVPDALASLLIGLLLAVTAFGLARLVADLLVGRSMPADEVQQLYAILAAEPAIEEVLALHAVYIGPLEAIVSAKVHPAARLTIDQLTHAMDALDRAIRTALPEVAEVYLDVTSRRLQPMPMRDAAGDTLKHSEAGLSR